MVNKTAAEKACPALSELAGMFTFLNVFTLSNVKDKMIFFLFAGIMIMLPMIAYHLENTGDFVDKIGKPKILKGTRESRKPGSWVLNPTITAEIVLASVLNIYDNLLP